MNAKAAVEEVGQDRRRGLRLRFWVAAFILVPVNTFWILFSEVIRYAGHPTTISLFYNVIFWLCLLVVVNAALRRFLPVLAFSRGELLTLYASLGITSGIAGHDTVEVLLPLLSYPARFANVTNNWADSLVPRLPKWLAVTDTAALDKFYTGNSSLYISGHWQAWVIPVLVWSLFLGLITFVTLCLNVVLRKQWTERERLAFPMVQLPLELTQPGNPLLREKALWAGVLIAVVLQLWNGWAYLDPRVPMIPLKYVDQGKLFTSRPWSAIGWLPVGFYPFAIALGVLLPLDLSFSSWVFFWFWKAQYVFAAAYGFDQIPNFPYTAPQSFGAYLGIALTALWGARKHLGNVIAGMFGDKDVPREADEDDDGLSTRGAAWGVVAGLVGLVTFCYIAGMTPWCIVAFFLLYFALVLAVTRMRAELGPPVHDLHQAGPNLIIPQVMGPSNIPKQDLTMFAAFFHGFNRAYRGNVSPIQLEGLQMTGRTNTSARSVFGAMAFFGFAAPIVAFWCLLHLSYQYGAAGAIGPPNVLQVFGSEGWNRYQSWTTAPPPPDRNTGIAVLVGMGFVLLLQTLRLRVIGFPFHPVGYAIASSWGMSILWLPMLLAWLTKSLILRYGGLGVYRKTLPFWYGIILGECVMGSLWTLIGMFSGVPTYGFWP